MTQEVTYLVTASPDVNALCSPDHMPKLPVFPSMLPSRLQPLIRFRFIVQKKTVMINLADYVCGGTGIYSYSWTNNRNESGIDPVIQNMYAPGQIVFDVDVYR